MKHPQSSRGLSTQPKRLHIDMVGRPGHPGAMETSGIFLGLFIAASLANVAACTNEKKHLGVIYITKPLLMPLLILYSATSSSAVNVLIVAALAFGCLGDVLLMLPGNREKLFLGGLGAFLVNQALYVAAFWGSLGSPAAIPWWIWALAIPYLFFGAAYFGLLAPRLGKLAGPVAVYMLVILAMGILALLRFPFAEGASFRAVLGGSVLFIASDSVLAYDRFVRPFGLARALVMATYIAAQFLIAWGFSG